MDNFVKAFARQPLSRQAGTIDGLVRFGAAVSGIDVGEKVTVTYRDGNADRTVTADYCVCTIPMPI